MSFSECFKGFSICNTTAEIGILFYKNYNKKNLVTVKKDNICILSAMHFCEPQTASYSAIAQKA